MVRFDYEYEQEMLFLASLENKAIRSFLHYLDCSPFEYGVHTQWSSLDTPVSLTLYIPFSLMDSPEDTMYPPSYSYIESGVDDICTPERTDDLFPESIYNKMVATDIVGVINRQIGGRLILGCKFTAKPKGRGSECVSLMSYDDESLQWLHLTRERLDIVPELHSRDAGDSYALYKMYRSHDREHSMTGFHSVYRGTTRVNGKCPPIDMRGLLHPFLDPEKEYPLRLDNWSRRRALGFLSVCVSLYPYMKGGRVHLIMVGSIRSYSKISDGTQESFIYTVLRRPYISVKIFHLPAGKGGRWEMRF